MLNRKSRRNISMKNIMTRPNSAINNMSKSNLSVLYEGIKSKDVERLQKILNDLVNTYNEMEVLVVDGIFGPKTKKNVEIFQTQNGLTANGVVDETTWKKLHEVHSQKYADLNRDNDNMYIDLSKNILKMGSKGRYVSDLQRYLNQVGMKYTSIPRLIVDGIFGPKTLDAVREFQRIFKVNDEIEKGIVGDITWTTLYNVMNGKLSGPESE